LLNVDIKSDLAVSANLMRYYETTIILDPLLDDEKVTEVTEKYAQFLTGEGCLVRKTEKSGRKKFAYPIKNRRTGTFVSIEFEGKPGMVSKLERAYHLDENVLRYLTVSFDRKTLVERQKYFQKKAELDAEREKIQTAESQEMTQLEQHQTASPGEES